MRPAGRSGAARARHPAPARIAALAVFAAAAVGAALLVALPLDVASGRYQDSIALLRERLAALQRIQSHRQVLEGQLARLEGRRDRSRLLFQEDSATIAGARLQEISKAAITEAGGELESIELRDVEQSGALERIGLRARFAGPVEAVQRTLHRLESLEPWIVVESLTVRAPDGRGADSRKERSAIVQLKVQLELSAHRQTGEGS